MTRIDDVMVVVQVELLEALGKFASFNSPHEGLAVIWEEFEELKEHVWANTGRSPEARNEAIQIAAMALRYVLDCAEPPVVLEEKRRPYTRREQWHDGQ